MISKENILLIFGFIITIVFLILKTNSDYFIVIIFSIFLILFFIEKIILGNSLKFSLLTIPSFFLLFYICLMSLPSIYWLLKLDFPLKNTYFLAIQSVLVSFPLGIGLANLFSKKPALIIKNFLNEPLTKIKNENKFLSLSLIIFFLSFPILMFYFLFVKHVPLIEIIKTYPPPINAEELRFSENSAPAIIQGLFEIMRRLFLPLCSLYLFFIAFLYKKKWKLIFAIIFFLTFIVSSLTLDRAEPVALIIAIVLAYLLIKKRSIFKTLTPKLLILILLAMIAGAIISVFQYHSSFTLERIVSNVKYMFLNRIILDPSNMASRAFIEFSNSSSFLNGSSIKLLAPVSGTSYSAYYPASFVGDLWRNFGWPGVIIGSIFLGFIFQLIQTKLFKRKSAFVLSIYIILMINTIWFIFGNTLGTISITIFLLSSFFLILANKINNRPSFVSSHDKEK